MTRKKVVIGFLGTRLDAGMSPKRWERWRPTVAMFAHDSFVPDELELLNFNDRAQPLVERVTADILEMRPDAKVRHHNLGIDDPWDFAQVYAGLQDFAKGYTFREDTDYYVHLTTGTHVAQICLFLLTEARYLPGKLLETSLAKRDSDVESWRGALEIIDLDLAAYDQLAKRFHKERLDNAELLKGGIVTRNMAF